MRILLLLSIIIMSCKNPDGKMALHLEERYVLDAIPSGSGMVIDNDRAYIVSDDAPGLFTVVLSSKEHRAIPITDLDATVKRIPKLSKPDYEALCRIRVDDTDVLLAFGSGSISPTRDSLLVIRYNTDSSQQKIPLTKLYGRLKGGNEVINIEGAASNGKDFYLMDREHNQLHQFTVSALVNFIKTNGTELPVHITTHTLFIPGMYATRISGGSFIDDHTLLFCASMEDTPDAIADGKIFGSVIGLLDVNSMKLVSTIPLTDSSGGVLADKLESVVSVEKNADGSYRVWAVADNDEGNTILFRLRLYVD